MLETNDKLRCLVNYYEMMSKSKHAEYADAAMHQCFLNLIGDPSNMWIYGSVLDRFIKECRKIGIYIKDKGHFESGEYVLDYYYVEMK